MLVSNTSALQLPDIYAQELTPAVTISGISTGVLAILGTSTKGAIYDTDHYSGFSVDFLNDYGNVYATGSKSDVTNYTSLQLGVASASKQGAGDIVPIRIGTSGSISDATITIASEGTGDFIATGYTPGTAFNGTTIVVEDDPNDGALKKITITAPDSSSEVYMAVDDFVDDVNTNSKILIVDLNDSDDPLPANGTYTLAGGADGITYGSEIPYADFIGYTTSDSKHTGLQLLNTMTDVRLFCMSEHYASLGTTTLGNFVASPSGLELDPATVEAISVATNIGAVGVISALHSLTPAQVKTLSQHASLKGTDRIILTYPNQKMYETTYKNILEVSPSSLYAGMYSTFAPNESPSNKNVLGILGPAKRLSRAQKVTFSSADCGVSAISEIPRGGFGPINGQNTSKNGALSQVLRRRMTDFLLISIDQAMGPYVSELNKPSTIAAINFSVTSFLASLETQGLIGDSIGGQAFSVSIVNTRPEALQRRLTVKIKVSLFSPADFIIIQGDVSFAGVNIEAA